jgi:hypothetical protein
MSSPQRKVIQAGLLLIFLGALWLIVSWSAPYFRSQLLERSLFQEAEAEHWPEARSFFQSIDSYKPQDWAHIHKIEEAGSHYWTPLVFVDFFFKAQPGKQLQPSVESRFSDVRMRWDRFLTLVAVLIGTAASEWLLLGAARREPVGPLDASSLRGLLTGEIARAEERTERLYRASRILLGAGILITLLGAGSLFWLPKDPQISEAQASSHDSSPAGLVSLLGRPYAVALYVQAIAFFFLRQYRASMAEYRFFDGLRWRRVDHLAALVALDEHQAQLAEVLLEESHRPSADAPKPKGK